ncbi:hypothetical protein [Cumulibacter manganitolerans]|uniref:hypothetical protein n=1 Tax=Cumulibacter manganitolerans TaxID=1884992 RepID=UPI001296ADEB|nr:hypothetical protein [Cumulibacter manganitolerans]
MLTVVEDPFAAPSRRSGETRVIRWTAAPGRDEVRAAVKAAGDEGLAVSGSLASLSLLVEGLRRAGALPGTPVAFLPGPSADAATHDLADLLALPRTLDEALASAPTELPLARNDIGGVLLHEASFIPAAGRTFGVQAYHDDERIADGTVRRIDVRIDYAAQARLLATVTPPSGRRRTSTTAGRAVQLATDPVAMVVDGRAPEEVDGRTWYVDDREHWLLRGAVRPALREPDGARAAGPRWNPFRRR